MPTGRHPARRRLAVVAVALSLLAGCSGPGSGGATTTTPPRPGPAAATASAKEPSDGASASADVGAAPSPAASPDPVPSSQPGPAAEPAAPAVPAPVFSSTVQPIGAELAERMGPSWRPGCPVPLEDLRYVTVSHVDFEGRAVTGELVVHADVAEGVVAVFAELFTARYPIRSMRLVDDFGADDTASMDADNTSAFNCRAITGGTGWSEHAYGRAIDLNPVENPYVVGSHVAPEAGRDFTDRPEAPGVVHDGDVVVLAFARAGWQWGGHWSRPVDYQHFSVSGR